MRVMISQFIGFAAGLFTSCGWFYLFTSILPNTTLAFGFAAYGAVFAGAAACWFGCRFCQKLMKP